MDNIKISLSLFVQGAGMLSSQECDKNLEKRYNTVKLPVEFRQGNRKVKETLVVKVRRPKLVTQHINITKEGYQGFIDTPVQGYSARQYKSLPKKERILKHLGLIKEDLHAVAYKYDILDD